MMRMRFSMEHIKVIPGFLVAQHYHTPFLGLYRVRVTGKAQVKLDDSYAFSISFCYIGKPNESESVFLDWLKDKAQLEWVSRSRIESNKSTLDNYLKAHDMGVVNISES